MRHGIMTGLNRKLYKKLSNFTSPVCDERHLVITICVILAMPKSEGLISM